MQGAVNHDMGNTVQFAAASRSMFFWARSSPHASCGSYNVTRNNAYGDYIMEPSQTCMYVAVWTDSDHTNYAYNCTSSVLPGRRGILIFGEGATTGLSCHEQSCGKWDVYA